MKGTDMSNDESNKKFDIESYWVSIQGKWSKSDKPQIVAETKSKFKSDLAKGQKSEHDFYVKYASCVVRTDGRRGDLEILKTGEIIELKSDFYDPSATNNFFMERFSYDDKPGGIWQAIEHGVDYYVYWFPLTGATYIFNAKQLYRKMNKLAKTLQLVSVKNQGFVTRGYKVERSLLKELFLEPESIGLYAK